MPAELPPDYRPRLRPGLGAEPDGTPDRVVLFDRFRVSPKALVLSVDAVRLVEQFDGSHTLRDVQSAALGFGVRPGDVARLVAALDDALFLDTPAFRAAVSGPVRKPTCVGVYPADPDGVRATCRALFTAPGGPGLPAAPRAGGPRLRAVLVPHMDYARGGVTYGWGFKELAERTDARVFVVVATSHYSPHRFTLTRANFETPLGVVETDQKYIDRLVAHYGDGLFDDPVAHLPEHSVELEVVLLQYLFETRGPVRIVPLVVGSFHDRTESGEDPSAAPDVARMVEALRRAEAEAGEPVCYVISGDLAHIGPKFDDPDPVAEPWLTESRRRDEAILDRLGAADPGGFFDVIAAEKDARRICGLPPAWLTLAAAEPRAGRVLHYGRYVHPAGHESVSFAAAAFTD